MRLARAMIPAALLAITAVSSCTALKAFAAEPAPRAPMGEAEFNRVLASLQSDTVLQCLDRQRLDRLAADAQLDACIAAVNEVEGGLNRLDHSQPALDGVYLYLDLALMGRFVSTLHTIDGDRYERVCRANSQQVAVASRIDLTAFDPAIADQLGTLVSDIRSLAAKCEGGA